MENSILPYYTNEQVIEMLDDLIGQPFTDDHIALVKTRTQRTARPNGADYFMTQDYIKDRVNLMVDAEGRIQSFEFY